MSEKVPNSVLEELRKALDPTPVGIVRELVRAGYEAYIVGGAIRDLLLGKTPKDYDISTSATPEQVRAVFGRRRCHVIGRRFRLAHVRGGSELYEVSTFRRQPNEQERQGRKHDDGPMIWNDNCFGTLEDDAKRRDFTVNALYFDVTGHRGVIDFSGGDEDIRKGVVRCIGKPAERMAEDPVRMLRALKLVGQCGFRLEPKLEAVIRANAPAIRLASSARLFEELLKLLANPSCDHTLQVMHDHGFLKEFWPTIEDSWEEQEGQMMCHLLKLRGEAIRRGRYSNSRGLALSTVALPFLMSALNPEKPTEFWEGNAAGDPVAHRALGIIFEGIALPRLLSERVLQIIGLVPRLVKKPVLGRYLNHVEYRYGRALVALLVQLFGWDRALLADLPEYSPRFDSEEEEIFGDEFENSRTESKASSPKGAAKEIPGLLPLVKKASTATEDAEANAADGDVVAQDETPQEKPKKRARKSKRTAAKRDSAPENSPALHEESDAPGREEIPVVEAPPAEPSVTFLNPGLSSGAVSFNDVNDRGAVVPPVKTRSRQRVSKTGKASAKTATKTAKKSVVKFDDSPSDGLESITFGG